MLECDCGKKFETYRQLNGHKSSHSRTALYKEKRKSTKLVTQYSCLNCSKENDESGSKINKYCDNKCQKEYEYKQAIAQWDIKPPGKAAIKRYLAETFGSKCSVCSIDEWNSKPIVLELEHKDGNSENNSKENVCLICPNCHSQTPTYKAKNKGNGRHARRQRYAEGKSF